MGGNREVGRWKRDISGFVQFEMVSETQGHDSPPGWRIAFAKALRNRSASWRF